MPLVQERLGSGRDEFRNSLLRTFFTLAKNGTFVVRSPFLWALQKVPKTLPFSQYGSKSPSP